LQGGADEVAEQTVVPIEGAGHDDHSRKSREQRVEGGQVAAEEAAQEVRRPPALPAVIEPYGSERARAA